MIPPFLLPIFLAVSGDPLPTALSGFTLLEPAAFSVTRVAGDELAHDIYTIALDAGGRVHVSGPGYIRQLIDADGDGVFEAAKDFYRGPASGCQGMVFHGTSLFATGGEGLLRFDDRDADGVADGPPQLLLPLAGGEHGAHALRIGPDGKLYFLGGNHCGLKTDRLSPGSPRRDFYAGVFCRMDLAAERVDVWVDGLRNAYDFDFTPTGEIFGWDSDSERNEGLDWYRPCRLYHFTPGADCGWRGMGTGEIPRGSIDAIDPVAEAGRGSPTGVLCYRHQAFPQRYHGGIFALDWTFGRVYHFRLVEHGATFVAEPEVFLAASGSASFAPTDIELDRDGSLLITSGGRGIAGSVYRLSAKRVVPSAGTTTAPSELAWVARAAAARRLGETGPLASLTTLLADEHLHVRRVAVESIARRSQENGATELLLSALSGAESGDLRLAQAIAAALSRFDPAHWPPARDAIERLILGHAHTLRAPRGKLPAGALDQAVAVLTSSLAADPADVDSVRYLSLSLRLLAVTFDRLKASEDPEYYVFDPTWERVDLSAQAQEVEQVRAMARLALGASGITRLEAMRLLAKLADPSPATATLTVNLLTETSPVAQDMLVFWCLAQLASDWDEATERRVVATAIALPEKLQRQQVGRDEKWSLYQIAIWERLGERHPRLCAGIVEHDGFGEAEHLELLGAAPAALLERAAGKLLARPLPVRGAEKRRALEFLGRNLRDGTALARFRPLLRQALDDPAVRRVALAALARTPEEEDRERFLVALDERDPLGLRPAILGLRALARPASAHEEIVLLLAWGLGAGRTARKNDLGLLAERLRDLTGTVCGEASKGEDPGREQFACWLEWLRKQAPKHAGELEEILHAEPRSEDRIKDLLEQAPWAAGDSQRGKTIFEARSCGSCHHLGGVGQRVGPDLAGVGRRLGLKELLVELIEPSRLVPERYFFTEYVLTGGERIEGMEIYSSRAAIRVVSRDGRDVRFSAAEVETASPRRLSLMPDGLLAGLSPAQVADLVAYLQSF